MQNTVSIVVIIVLFAIMYFLMIRPQKKRQQKHSDLINKLKKGDQVITIGRLHGTVDEIDRKDKIVSLDCDGIHLTFDLRAIATLVKTPEPADDKKSTSSKKATTASDEKKTKKSADK